MVPSRGGQLSLGDLVLMVALVGVVLAWTVPAAKASPIAWPAFLASAGFVAAASARRFTPAQTLNMMAATIATTALPLLRRSGDPDYLLAKYLLTLAILIALWVLDPRKRRRSRAAAR